MTATRRGRPSLDPNGRPYRVGLLMSQRLHARVVKYVAEYPEKNNAIGTLSESRLYRVAIKRFLEAEGY